MKNYIEIEKYKASYTTEGVEVLTQVDAIEGQRTIKKENYLNDSLRQSLLETIYALNVTTDNIGKIEGFSGYTLGISNLNLVSKYTLFDDNVGTDESNFYTGFMLGTTPTDASVTTESGSDVRTVAFKGRFSPPATTPRVINSLRVLKDVASSQQVFNHIHLDVPCNQGTDEILIVNYRYQYNFKAIADTLPYYEALKSKAPSLAEGAIRNLGYMVDTATNLNRVPERFYMGTGSLKLDDGNFVAPLYGADAVTVSTATYKHPITSRSFPSKREGFRFYYSDLPINRLNGNFMHSVLMYNSTSFDFNGTSQCRIPVAEVKLRNPHESTVQNGYLKQLDAQNNARKPFYDIDNVGSSLGKVNVVDTFESGDSSYESIPHLAQLIRTEFVDGGATGNATYKLSTRFTAGFKGVDNWLPQPSTPVLVGRRGTYDTKTYLSDLKDRLGTIPVMHRAALGRFIHPLVLGEVLVYMPWATDHPEYGLWVYTLDLRTEPLHITPTTLQGYGATDIRGVTTAEDGTIFVACANTGLWKLKRNKGDSLAAMQVTHVTNTGATDDTKCYGVNFVRLNHRFNSNGRLAAVFGDDLVVSENGGTSWSMYNATSNPKFVHDYDFAKLVGINGHPTKDIIALVYSANPLDEFLSYSTPKYSDSSHFSLNTSYWYRGLSTPTDSISHTHYLSGYPDDIPAVFAYKGGSNFFTQPVLHSDYSFYTSRVYSYLEPILLEPTTAVYYNVQGLTDNSFYNTQAPMLIDNTVENATYLLCPTSTTNNGSVGASWLKSLAALTSGDLTGASILSYAQTLWPIPAGRGVMLTYGTELEQDFVSVFQGYSSYLPLERVAYSYAHIGVDSREFYQGNAMNFWYEYTYNSAQSKWELLLDGTATPKLTHTAEAATINGLKCSFADDEAAVGSTGNFIAGEVHDQYVCDGVLKDDYTAIKFDFLAHYGNSLEGNTFTPSTVPANPLGVVTEKLTVQYAKVWDNGSIGGEYNYLPIYFDPTYITSNSYVSLYNTGSSDEVGNVTLGENILGDFTLETYLSYDSSTEALNAATTSSDLLSISRWNSPHFMLEAATTITGLTVGSPVYGFRLARLNTAATLNDLTMVVYDVTGGHTLVDIPNFSPNDVFTVTRTGNQVQLARNGEEIHVGSVTAPSLRASYRVASGTGEARYSHYYGILTSLYKPKLTYNSQALKVKLGDEVAKTGAFSPNFQYASYIEWISGLKKLYLNGVEATLIYDRETNEPPAGSIRINIGSGELLFNSADAGKAITGDWRIINGINANEV